MNEVACFGPGFRIDGRSPSRGAVGDERAGGLLPGPDRDDRLTSAARTYRASRRCALFVGKVMSMMGMGSTVTYKDQRDPDYDTHETA